MRACARCEPIGTTAPSRSVRPNSPSNRSWAENSTGASPTVIDLSGRGPLTACGLMSSGLRPAAYQRADLATRRDSR